MRGVADFVADASYESEAKVCDSLSRDMKFAVIGDCVGYMLGCCVIVGEVFFVEICKFGVYVVCYGPQYALS